MSQQARTPESFTCALCRGVFLKGWTDEEASAERDALFPMYAQGNDAIVCDDCFQKIRPHG